jgi:hypothetical protein
MSGVVSATLQALASARTVSTCSIGIVEASSLSGFRYWSETNKGVTRWQRGASPTVTQICSDAVNREIDSSHHALIFVAGAMPPRPASGNPPRAGADSRFVAGSWAASCARRLRADDHRGDEARDGVARAPGRGDERISGHRKGRARRANKA